MKAYDILCSWNNLQQICSFLYEKMFICTRIKYVPRILISSFYINQCQLKEFELVHIVRTWSSIYELTKHFRDVLKRNGTAVDAAIAALFCDGILHPASMGLGGGFIMTIFIKSENKVFSLMARETAPKNAFQTMFVNNSYAARKGALAVAVPGELLGYEEAKNRFGNPDVTWASLIEPSIRLCEEGIPITETISHYFNKDYVQDYFNSYEPLR